MTMTAPRPPSIRIEPPAPPYRRPRDDADEKFFAARRAQIADVAPTLIPVLIAVDVQGLADDLVRLGLAVVVGGEELRKVLRRFDAAVVVMVGNVGGGAWVRHYCPEVRTVDPAALARCQHRRQVIDLAFEGVGGRR